MSKSKIQSLLLCLLLMATLVCVPACSDDDDDGNLLAPPADTDGWQEHGSFRLDNKILLAGYATDEMLFMPGWTSFNTLDSEGNAIHWFNWGFGKLETPICPSEEIHAFANLYSLYLRPNANPVSEGTDLLIDPTDIVESFQFWGEGLDRTGRFNDSGQLMVSFTYRTEEDVNTAGLCLLNLNVVTLTQGETVELESQQFIPIPTNGTSISVLMMAPVDDGFLVAASNGLWHVDSSGDLDLLIDQRFDNLFVDGDSCWAIRWDGDIWHSANGGMSWEANGTVSPSHIRLVSVADKTVGYLADWIYEMDLENHELTKLDTELLEGNEITSVVEFQGEVYVTTLSGLFHRPVEAFFTPAPDQDKATEVEIIR